MAIRRQLGDIIFETDTPAARAFDIALLWAIVLSVLLVIAESIESLQAAYGPTLRTLEWIFTLLFTVEYVVRVYSARERRRYVLSFYGLIDLLAVLPTYLSLVLSGTQYLIVLRSLRLLRMFRVFKLARYLGEANVLATALRASREKIVVFMVAVVAMVLIIGSAMYVIEGPESGFDNIPTGIYWAIVTLTTVGYGDIIPTTALGRFLAAVVMITGYAIIAVPTGIVTTELSRASGRPEERLIECPGCGLQSHAPDARYCRRCGTPLDAEEA